MSARWVLMVLGLFLARFGPEELVLLNREDAKDTKEEELRGRKKWMVFYQEGSHTLSALISVICLYLRLKQGIFWVADSIFLKSGLTRLDSDE